MMLQEFQTNIVKNGEISMMVFDGNYIHTALKIAKLSDFRVQDDYGGSIHGLSQNAPLRPGRCFYGQ